MDTNEQAPPLHYEGQLWSRESAAAKLAEIDKDEDFKAALLKGDMVKVAERAAYSQMAKGQQPGPAAAPPDSDAVTRQMGEREEAIHEAQLDAWSAHTHPTLEARLQMKRGLATRQQIEHARDSIRHAKGDPEFARKVTTPGIGAKEKEMWASWHFAAHHCREAPADYDWSNDKLDAAS